MANSRRQRGIVKTLPQSATRTREDAATLKVSAEAAIPDITFLAVPEDHTEADDVTWYSAD